MPTIDDLRAQAWKKALEACGTSAIFSRRASKIEQWAKWRDFLGVFIPLMLGVIVADISFIDSKAIAWLVAITAIPTLVQLAISVWSLVAGWNEALPKYLDAQVANNRLRREWEAFGQQIMPSTEENFHRLLDQTNEREHADMRVNFSDAERRYGMRYGLREFERECPACKIVPKGMKPTKCDVCGNF